MAAGLIVLCHIVWVSQVFVFVLLQQTVAASMTDLERKNLRRAMYSREAVRTEEEEEEGESSAACQEDFNSMCVCACLFCFLFCFCFWGGEGSRV